MSVELGLASCIGSLDSRLLGTSQIAFCAQSFLEKFLHPMLGRLDQLPLVREFLARTLSSRFGVFQICICSLDRSSQSLELFSIKYLQLTWKRKKKKLNRSILPLVGPAMPKELPNWLLSAFARVPMPPPEQQLRLLWSLGEAARLSTLCPPGLLAQPWPLGLLFPPVETWPDDGSRRV